MKHRMNSWHRGFDIYVTLCIERFSRENFIPVIKSCISLADIHMGTIYFLCFKGWVSRVKLHNYASDLLHDPVKYRARHRQCGNHHARNNNLPSALLSPCIYISFLGKGGKVQPPLAVNCKPCLDFALNHLQRMSTWPVSYTHLTLPTSGRV